MIFKRSAFSESRAGRPQGPRSHVIIVLLLLALGLAGVLAFQAQSAARSHRAAAESALKDYAAFAAWDYAGRVKKSLDFDVFSRGLKPFWLVGVGTPEFARLTPQQVVNYASQKARHAAPGLARTYFAVDLRTNASALTSDGAPNAVCIWLANVVRSHARQRFTRGNEFASFLGNTTIGRDVVAYLVVPDSAPGMAYGFVANVRTVENVLARAFSSAPLLPASLTHGVPNDSLLSVFVSDSAGTILYRSSSAPYEHGSISVQDTLASAYSGLRVKMVLRPQAASMLLIGGLPRSRLPSLIGVLLLTAGLVAAAMVQLRREQQLARLRTEFVSNVSHELRTPLAQIRMFGETLLLDRIRSDDERRRSLRILDQEARRLTHLVENVLHFSRAERQMTRVETCRTQLAPLMREVIEAFAPLAAARGTRIESELEDAVIAPVDGSALRQVLLNLLDNAVKYGPAGQTVRVSLHLRAEQAIIHVDDEGPGVPAAARTRIWEPFWRMDRERESAIAGTGIGLAVVDELVRKHGGTATVTDAPTGGARFILELPGAERSADSAAEHCVPAGGVDHGAEQRVAHV